MKSRGKGKFSVSIARKFHRKSEENQVKIGLIPNLKNFISRRIGVRVSGYSMSGIFEYSDVVGAKKVTRSTRYSIGDIIVFENNDGNKVIHMILVSSVIIVRNNISLGG